MNVKLSIEDDKELRDMIKQMIKSQVVSVAREEIREILKEVFNSKYALDKERAEKLIEDEARKYVRDRIHSLFYENYYSNNNALKDMARTEINQKVKEMFEYGRAV